MELIITERPATICLNMIVKDESHIIEKTLTSLCDKIKFDYWVICDTGSTDNTPQIIQDFFDKRGIKGELFYDAWVNFAHNRTLALQRAFKKTQLLLVFDADDEIFGSITMPTEVLFDEYHLKFGSSSGTSYTRVLLINNYKSFEYLSVIHEFITCKEGPVKSTTIEGNYYVESGRTGNRSKDPNKYLKDALILEKAYAEALEKKDHLFHRYSYYCANSYKDFGKFEDAIKWYKITLSHEHQWNQEKYTSCLYIYDCYKALGQEENGFYYLVESFKHDDERVEGLFHLLVHYCCKDMKKVAYNYYLNIKEFFENRYLNADMSKKLFMINDKYNFFVPYYMIIIADKNKDYQCAIKMYEIIFTKKQRVFDEWHVKHIWLNLQFFIQYIPEDSKTRFQSLANEYMLFLHNNGVNFDTDAYNFLEKDVYKNAGIVNPNNIITYDYDYDYCKQAFFTQPAQDDTDLKEIDIIFNNLKKHKNSIDLDTDTNKLELFYSVDKCINKLALKNISIGKNMLDMWELLFTSCSSLLTKPSEFVFTPRDKCDVFISFTTCKRIDLFQKTIHSILNHWSDIQKIDYWFCVDDNSSNEDRTLMKTLFPWINFYMKPIEEKGHRDSMNIIWNKLNEIKPTYWIHMEDDFLFYKKIDYISFAIDSLNSSYCINNKVKQILFNRNYGETIEDYRISGHIRNEDDCNIVMHKHCEGHFNYSNCHYWPNYSLRPSLIEVNAILELGNFDSNNTFFEMDYAKKWTSAGYTSAFLNTISNRHIGRLTKERNSKTLKNAYELNNEGQFESNNINKFKIVNLERRVDRKEDTIAKLTNVNIPNNQYQFINAVDGSKLKPTIEIKNLFFQNDFGYKRGVIGCALSHLNLWKELLNDEKNDYYIIMEDDAIYASNIYQKIEMLRTNKEFLKKEMLFLGYHMFEKYRQMHFKKYNVESDTINITPLDRQLYIGGFFCYSINKTAAKKLIDYISENGIKHGIDYIIKLTPNLQMYECQPQLVFSIWNEDGKAIDTDIQNKYDPLDFTNIVDELSDLQSQFIFIPNLDQHGNDICYKKVSLHEQFKIAIQDDNCIGFNTLGFFKNKLTELNPSKYFGKNDGLYVKKQVYEHFLQNKSMSKTNSDGNIRVKMLCNWCSSEQLCKEWSNMCEEGFRWKNFELVWTNVKEDIDYYVIINSPPNDAYFEPDKTIVFQMEPWVTDANKRWGVKSWGKWAEPEPTDFLEVRGRKTEYHNNAFWQLELTLNDLNNSILFEKNKENIISSICSSKYFDEGHIERIDFLKFLEQKGDIALDIYNQDNNHAFKNYRGPLSPYVDKSKGIKPYKYYFMVENNYERNFITEKIWEPILCETLVFYYGCPNVTDYINKDAFVLLDMTDFEKSYQTIKQAICEDWWSQRIEIIRKEKQKILNKLAFFPTIKNIIMKHKYSYNTYFQNFTNLNVGEPKKYCFIHSCHIKKKGIQVLNNIINTLINSNAIQYFEKIFIVNIGEKIASDYFAHDKIQIINYSNNLYLWEIPTINLLRVFCENNDNCQILYLHTKGISHNNSNNKINDWTNMMLYFLASKCTDCFELFKLYDAVGCNYSEKPFKHFSGNFWWANSNYIKQLDLIDNNRDRHSAEWWILSDPKVKSFSIHNSNVNHYNTEYPPEKYCQNPIATAKPNEKVTIGFHSNQLCERGT